MPRPLAAFVCLLAALSLVGCSGLSSIPAPPPNPRGFDVERAVSLLTEAETAETAGDMDKAGDLYQSALTQWPVTLRAWQGLARVTARQGQTERRTYALFFADRVATYDAMHPRAARMAYLTAVDQPAEAPGIPEMAQRMADFYTYKDEVLVAERVAGQTERSALERYAIYPVALLSVGGVAFLIIRNTTAFSGSE